MFKSFEEKEAARREREAQKARAEAERARAEAERAEQAWLTTPVGMATTAKQAGQRFFEIQLQVGGHDGQASRGVASGERTVVSSAAVLAQIEDVGWRLEHASYVYVVTGETSTERVFLSGQQVAVSGVTVGVYLFRNVSG